MIAMLTMARILNRNFIESLHLRFENTELLRDLTVQRQAADAANRAKTDFIAAVSHDLRQPVHALGLFTTTLSGRTTDPDVRKIVQKMDRSIRAMQHLFTALLDVSRLEAGVIKPRPRDFLVAKSVRSHCARPRRRSRRTSSRAAYPSTSAVAHSDPALIEIVLRNLVGNALAHAQRGRVLIACRGQGFELCIEVWDQGIGIPAEHQARIFEDYYRVVDTTTTPPPRARRARARHRDARGAGTPPWHRAAFHARGRYDVQVASAARRTIAGVTHGPSVRPPTTLAGIFVVVIDDDDTILQAMNALLGTWGCRVVILARSRTQWCVSPTNQACRTC